MGTILKQALISRIKEVIEQTEMEPNKEFDINFYEGLIDGLLIALNIIKNEF